jgi:hypothetical protein
MPVHIINRQASARRLFWNSPHSLKNAQMASSSISYAKFPQNSFLQPAGQEGEKREEEECGVRTKQKANRQTSSTLVAFTQQQQVFGME